MWPKSADDTTHLFLIRHGATEANERRPYVLQGRGINFPLSETGRRQARAVAKFLSAMPIGAVYCSSLERAMETAREIAGPLQLEALPLEGIHEVDVGEWEGKSWDMVLRENESAYRAFMEDPGDTPYLNGESYRDVLLRAKPVLSAVIEQHPGENIVVVAHNVVNRAYLADVMGLQLKRAKDIHQSNCCVNIVRRQEGRTELLTLNAHFHLYAEEPSAEAASPSGPTPGADEVAG